MAAIFSLLVWLFRPRRATLPLALLLCLLSSPAWAQTAGPDDKILSEVGFDQRLDQQVPLDLIFRDESGASVRLGDYFGDRPVILTLNYYECPNLCTLVLTKLVETMRKIGFDAGQQFAVVTVSIDPRETSQLAAAKKASYVERYGRPGAAGGWHFLTGEQQAIEQLAAAVGFRYAYDARQNQYAHPSGVVVLTPQGKVSRYFYNLDYQASDLRLGLVEASAGTIGSAVDQILLRCYHYDPQSGTYTLAIMNLVRLVAAATTLLLGASVWALLRRERRQRGPLADPL